MSTLSFQGLALTSNKWNDSLSQKCCFYLAKNRTNAIYMERDETAVIFKLLNKFFPLKSEPRWPFWNSAKEHKHETFQISLFPRIQNYLVMAFFPTLDFWVIFQGLVLPVFLKYLFSECLNSIPAERPWQKSLIVVKSW